MYSALSIVALVFSIAASIASIVAHFFIRRVEKKLVDIKTRGANSPIYIAGGDLSVTSISESVTNTIQSNINTTQPSITPPPTTESP